MDRTRLSETQKWVVKIGSGVIVRDGVRIDRPTFASLVSELATQIESGRRTTVVSSGAVALGCQRLGIERERSIVLPRLQALAALGQSRLIQTYDREFENYGMITAQLLLGRDDLDGRTSYLNARNALDAVHRFGAVPIINENDTVATHELRFGDNDQLAAMVCGLAQADLLVLLSDVDGVFHTDVGADGELVFGDRIATAQSDDDLLDRVAGPSQGKVGTGGMRSKIAAARLAARFGVPTVIARGKRAGVLASIAAGEDVGTLIVPSGDEVIQGRKVWLSAGARPIGAITCDDGAIRAITERGASLLPSGVLSVEGDFDAGAVVDVRDASGHAVGRGVACYGAREIEALAGRQSEEIDQILGYRGLDCVVHRDELVLEK
jgi:glutamate 5-kinase